MATTKPFSSALVALILVLLAFALHASVLGLSFFSDDFSVIHRVGAQGDLGTGSFFRPLPDWTLYLNYRIAGPSAMALRAINVLLLGINGWLAYLLGRNLLPHGEHASPALIGALLFVCYPFHNEPQLWIIGRSTIMATSFTLLALIAATGRSSRPFRCVAVGICGWLGAMCYELALLLPLLLFVLMTAVHPGERRTWWSMTLVSAGVVVLNLLLRSVLTGDVANAYGTSFFEHGILSYLTMAGKILGRLFLPPHPDEHVQLTRFAVLMVVLLVILFLLFRRTRYERIARILLLVFAVLTAVACGIGIIGGVSTRTSESDRFLYLPSAFLCMLIALCVTMLARGRVRIAIVAVLMLASIITMKRNHANWIVASKTIERIVEATPSAPAGGRLFVTGLPGDHNGAFIFRHGFHEALLMAGRDTVNIVRVDTLLFGMSDARGLPVLSNEDREDTLFVLSGDHLAVWTGDGFSVGDHNGRCPGEYWVIGPTFDPMRLVSIVLSIVLANTAGLVAQIPVTPVAKEDPRIDGPYIGVGLGQDVGGVVGARLTYHVAPYISGFVGGGWAVIAPGYNVGVELRPKTERRVSPFFVGMYGYNGVIHVEDRETLDAIYYGPTLGGGVMLQQRQLRNYWRFAINVPIRSQEMLDDWEAVKARPDVEVKQDMLPFTIGIGFHFGI